MSEKAIYELATPMVRLGEKLTINKIITNMIQNKLT